jgi:hypothetical protein
MTRRLVASIQVGRPTCLQLAVMGDLPIPHGPLIELHDQIYVAELAEAINRVTGEWLEKGEP